MTRRPVWHPDRFADRLALLRRRGLMRAGIRAFFEARGYMEVETPILVPAPGEEVHLAAFRTGWTRANGVRQTLWLHTSPEFAMKRLLVAGAGPIFQFARVFRNEQESRSHAPEFTMLEWYRPGATLNDLMDETEALLRAVLPPCWEYNGQSLDLTGPAERISMQAAFLTHAGVDLLACGEDAAALARASGMALLPDENWESLFFRLLLERVEPRLGRLRPSFLTHWPAAQAALARRAPADGRVAERFELFLGGMELANAFIELTDEPEQRARFMADRARRHALTGGADWPLDEDFLAALRHGMPEAGGVALGFDRLVMLGSGAARIADVQYMPLTVADEDD